MHHENEMSQAMKDMIAAKFVDIPLGSTGSFPGGKLTATDLGEIAFGVGIYKSKVIVTFGASISTLGMSPIQARRLGQSLISKANAITKSPKRERKRARKRKSALL